MCRILRRRLGPLPPNVVLLFQLCLPELSILQKNINCGRHRHIESGKALHESPLQNIIAKKAKRGSKQGIRQAPALALFSQFLRRYGGEPVNPLDVILDISVREMVQWVSQAPDFSVYENLLVRVHPSPSCAVPSKQADIIVRVPTTPPPPARQITN